MQPKMPITKKILAFGPRRRLPEEVGACGVGESRRRRLSNQNHADDFLIARPSNQKTGELEQQLVIISVGGTNSAIREVREAKDVALMTEYVVMVGLH